MVTEEIETLNETLDSAVQAQENGARVSVDDDKVVKDDVYVGGNGGGIVETRVVEAEMSVEKNFVCSNGGGGGGGGGFIGDAKETRSPVLEGLTDGGSTLLNSDGSCKEIGLDENGGSVVEEVHGSLDSMNEKEGNCGYVDNKGSVAENEGNPGEEFMKIPGSKGNGKFEANHNGEGEEDAGDEEHEYSVGDYVWVKIRSHPWWPGRIYDPSDASEYARKYSHGGTLLVAYFGDKSFSWCSPSQLKPFAEEFLEMSGQSNSKSFVNAVQNAIDEISLKKGVRHSSTGEDSLEAESEKITKVARVGERMISAASQLIGSTPVVHCTDETEVDTVAISSPNPLREDQKKFIDTVKINASTREVVAEVWSAAINPLHMKEKSIVDMLWGFISEFRSALNLHGSNYKNFHKRQAVRKRKLPSSGLDDEIPESKSQRKGNEKKEWGSSGVKKLEKDDGELGKKRKKKETIDNKKDGEAATTPVTLIVMFPPGFSLPSKNDLKAVFSKFGALNETETEVLYNCSCAMVVFVKNSDAEEAFNACMNESPFRPAKVSYRLRYSSDIYRKPSVAASKEEGKKPVNDASRVLFTVKEKLELMTSMLEKSDGNMLPEVQSKFEAEMKGLLEVVNAVI